jgi:membrane peptidoglycan carboxypeptidase
MSVRHASSRNLGAMPRPETDRLPARKVASHLGVMLAVAAVLGVVVSGLAIPFAGVIGLTARNVADASEELPQELETDQLPQRTIIEDKAGNPIATIYDQNRINITLKQIAPVMRKAIIAIEDFRFYQHGALDLKGTLRALLTNQAADGVVQGGSSITQQLVKLTLVNQAEGDEEAIEEATDESYARKLRELRYAIALEKKHSKDWILERYLNTAYFGDGAYGIQSAARHYFNVDAKDLNLRQSAMLAGLVQSPDAFDPTNNRERAKERRDVVLDRMADLGAVPVKDAETAKAKPLGLDVQPMPNGCGDSTATFFCEFAYSYLLQDPALGKTRKARERLIRKGGLTITTTIDTRVQKAADQSVRNHVWSTDNAIGALSFVQPGTGEVKALAQSRHQLGSGPGQTWTNFTVPKKYGGANGFQPGSTFKSFVLAAAINQGVPLTRTFSSAQPAFMPENQYRVCGDQPYPSSGVWEVKNSTESSSNPNLYEGTQKSVNTFFARLEVETGLCKPYRLAKSMGINLTDPSTQMVPSFTLGVVDVSPLEMASAYATFAGRGMYCEPRPIAKIEDANGNVLKEYKPECERVLPETVADAVNDVLKGVVGPGGFGEALNPGQASAGKTGTTSSNKAVWFVGYTPNLAGAATVAGVAPRTGNPISLDSVPIAGYVRSTSGSGTAGPIWGDAMAQIAPLLEDKEFVRPSPEQVAGILTTVPSVSGLSVDDARAALEEAGFAVAVGSEVNSTISEGLVAYSYPGSGSQVGAGNTITIYPSTGYVPPPPKKDKKGNGGNGGDDGRRGNGGDRGRGND